MRRDYYNPHDFDLAIRYLHALGVYYIMPIHVFMTYRNAPRLNWTLE